MRIRSCPDLCILLILWLLAFRPVGRGACKGPRIDARDVTGSRLKKGAHHGQGSALVVSRRPVQLDRDPLARRDSSIRRREHLK
jgi:hypothetical protein